MDMKKEPKVKLGDRVKIAAFETQTGIQGLVYGITHYIDGSYGYSVITTDYNGTSRHNVGEYEVHKVATIGIEDVLDHL
jgi:hypothetical protein